MLITGIMIYYDVVCKRKLWYFIHGIQMENNSELVEIGKIIDETSYQRNDKHINIDNVINIDYIHSKDELHEIKKSNKIEQATIEQVKYYLYYLKQRGVQKKAVIDYPLLKQTVPVELSEEDENRIKERITEIEQLSKSSIPEMKLQRICKSCAYHDLCCI